MKPPHPRSLRNQQQHNGFRTIRAASRFSWCGTERWGPGVLNQLCVQSRGAFRFRALRAFRPAARRAQHVTVRAVSIDHHARLNDESTKLRDEASCERVGSGATGLVLTADRFQTEAKGAANQQD
jgi:choline dehydrogenase-like flavoprotein